MLLQLECIEDGLQWYGEPFLGENTWIHTCIRHPLELRRQTLTYNINWRSQIEDLLNMHVCGLILKVVSQDQVIYIFWRPERKDDKLWRQSGGVCELKNSKRVTDYKLCLGSNPQSRSRFIYHLIVNETRASVEEGLVKLGTEIISERMEIYSRPSKLLDQEDVPTTGRWRNICSPFTRLPII